MSEQAWKIERVGVEATDVIVAAADMFDEAPTEDTVRGFFSREGRYLFLARLNDGRAVGYAAVIEDASPNKPLDLNLYDLSVATDWRNKGIGKALVKATVDLAHELKASGIWAVTEIANEPARQMYEKSGLKQIDDYQAMFEVDV